MNVPTLVTVVTPSYNQAAYLEDCIRSVLAQNSSSKNAIQIEYLVVDGGSTDGSQEIIHKYEEQLAWSVSESDAGQAEAINKGFLHSKGDIFAWLNSDDLYLPGSVAAAVKALQEDEQLGMVYGDAVAIDQHGSLLNRWNFADWGLKDLMRFRVICQPAVFMRRSVLEKCGLLDTNYHFMLDHKLWLQIARCSKVKHIPQVWAAARMHTQAKNVSQPGQFGEEIFRILTWMRTQPDLAPLVSENQRQIEAGAYRLKGRYQLDGGNPGEALRAYGNALVRDPRYTLRHWHRMVFAGLDLLGAGRAANWYYKLKRKLNPVKLSMPGLEQWPGLHHE